MRLGWDHGESSYARSRNCTCQPCVVAVNRYHARRDGIVDPVAVDRLASGDPVWATHTEIEAAAVRLVQSGLSHTAAAARLGQSNRTIERLLAHSRTAVAA